MAGLSMGGMQTRPITLANLDKFSHIGIFSGGSIAPADVADLAAFKRKVKVVFVSYGSREDGAATAKTNARRWRSWHQERLLRIAGDGPRVAELAAEPVPVRAAAVPELNREGPHGGSKDVQSTPRHVSGRHRHAGTARVGSGEETKYRDRTHWHHVARARPTRRRTSDAGSASRGAGARLQPAAAGAAAPGGARRGGGPPPPDPALNEAIFKDVSELGFSGLELFDWQINGLESQGVLAGFVEKFKLPLISSYTSINLTDPAQRAETIAAAVAVGKILKKYGGRTIVIGPSGRVGGASYNYNDHKQNIVTTLNELGKAITDIGLIAALHQHTGTAVETRDETYATMEAVDTRCREVRSGHRPAAEGRRRSGGGRQELPARRPAHALQGLGGWSVDGRLLRARTRQGGPRRRFSTSWRAASSTA